MRKRASRLLALALALFLVAVLTAPAASAAERPPSPTERLLASLEALEPSEIGTDRHGNLWAWSHDTGKVVLFDEEGRERQRWSVPEAHAVDVDAEWGLVALGTHGEEISVVGKEEEAQSAPIGLSGAATKVDWLAAGRVAVASALGAHRIQIWDLTEGVQVDRLDEEGPVPQGVGTKLARSTYVKALPRRGELFVLDSFTGELEVFDPDGEKIRQAAVRDQERERFEEWLEQADAEARKTGDVQRPRIWRFRFDTSPDGSAWIVESCSESGVAELVRLRPDGRLERPSVETSCCSRHLAVWQGQAIFFENRKIAVETCYGTGGLPDDWEGG